MKERGFTIFEIAIVIAIMGILTGFILSAFSNVSSKKALDGAADDIVSTLAEARAETLSSQGGAQYGVNFSSSQFTLFKGSSYASGASTNVATTLNSAVGIRNISLAGGGSSVVFDRLTGATENAGTLEVYLLAATTTSLRITVSATGLAEIK